MPIVHEDSFRAWEACAVPGLRDDPRWKFNAYRVSLYMLDQTQQDFESFTDHARDAEYRKLITSVAMISANVSEGLKRTAAGDRARFYGHALESLRESIAHYHALADLLAGEIVEQRIEQLGELKRILIGSQKWLAAARAPD